MCRKYGGFKMTTAEEEFWCEYYSKEEAEDRRNKNISKANSVIFVLTIVVVVVWVWVKI